MEYFVLDFTRIDLGAEQLVVSKRTASTHVTNILNKLAFNSRRQITAWVTGQKLGS